jgi:hypothetical protein
MLSAFSGERIIFYQKPCHNARPIVTVPPVMFSHAYNTASPLTL